MRVSHIKNWRLNVTHANLNCYYNPITFSLGHTIMAIWVDADACPVVLKEILFRAAQRTQTLVTLVANRSMRLPSSPYIKSIQVEAGFDVADHKIVELAQSNDLIITNDIPLAAEVIEKGAIVLTSRGERLTAANVRSRLNMRDFMDTLRSSGIQTGGPAPLSQRDRAQFGNELDRYLAKQPPRTK